MRAIDADKLLRDIEKYHVSDGKFQHWIQIQPTIKPEQRWIPCSEKYPNPGERVLVTIGGYDMWVWDCKADREDDFYFWEDEQGFYHNKYEIDAWMPLPKPWRG